MVEYVVSPILSVQENHQMVIVDPHAQITALWSHVADLEDGHLQNNVRGMPESI